jgi:aspartate/methionine/tyrosine aminotransferase
MAAHINRHFYPLDILDDEKLTFSSGTTAMVEMLAHTLGDHGDGVLLDRPMYSSHEKDLRLTAGYASRFFYVTIFA